MEGRERRGPGHGDDRITKSGSKILNLAWDESTKLVKDWGVGAAHEYMDDRCCEILAP